MMIESSSNIWGLYISQFVRDIAIAEHDMFSTLNRCLIFCKLRNYRISIYRKTRPDFSKCASGILKFFQLKIFVKRHTLPIKMTPKFIMLDDNTTQFFAEFNSPPLDTIECAAARSICCQEKYIKTISNKILN